MSGSGPYYSQSPDPTLRMPLDIPNVVFAAIRLLDHLEDDHGFCSARLGQ